MISLYCKKHHGGTGLCEDCKDLHEYSQKRLQSCPFQTGKTACGKCKVHCYKPVMLEKVRTVMREIGPTMIYRHPLMAFGHVIDSLRKKPQEKGARERR